MANFKLKELRLSKGLKQSDMAKMLELATSSYCEKENGNRKFTIEEAFKISSILDRKVEEIFLSR